MIMTSGDDPTSRDSSPPRLQVLGQDVLRFQAVAAHHTGLHLIHGDFHVILLWDIHGMLKQLEYVSDHMGLLT